MPYIEPQQRFRLDEVVEHLDKMELGDGELNYLITRIVARAYKVHMGPRYSLLQSAVGLLECVKLEFARRGVAPYEDDKIGENGDVREYDRF